MSKKENDINYWLRRDLERKGHLFILANYYIGNWECDIYSLCRSGYSSEFEIKISRSDFFADFNKNFNSSRLFLREKTLVMKHDKIKSGERTNRFYFVVPESLITVSEVPDYAGLVYYKPEIKRFDKIKEAPLLHRRKIILNEKDVLFDIAYSLHYKYWHLFYQNRRIKNIL